MPLVAKAAHEREDEEQRVLGDGDGSPYGVTLELAPKFAGRGPKVDVREGVNVDRVSQRLDPTNQAADARANAGVRDGFALGQAESGRGIPGAWRSLAAPWHKRARGNVWRESQSPLLHFFEVRKNSGGRCEDALTH